MAKDKKQNAQSKPITAEEREVLARWEKDNDAINEKFVQEGNTTNAEFVNKSDEINMQFSEEHDSIQNKHAQGLLNGKQEQTAMDKALKKADADDVDNLKDADNKDTVSLKNADAAEDKITTPQVKNILDRELLESIPALEAAGEGKRIGNKDSHITLGELKKTLSYDGKHGLYGVDADRDGCITPEEIRNYLDLVVPPTPTAKQKDPDPKLSKK